MEESEDPDELLVSVPELAPDDPLPLASAADEPVVRAVDLVVALLLVFAAFVVFAALALDVGAVAASASTSSAEVASSALGELFVDAELVVLEVERLAFVDVALVALALVDAALVDAALVDAALVDALFVDALLVEALLVALVFVEVVLVEPVELALRAADGLLLFGLLLVDREVVAPALLRGGVERVGPERVDEDPAAALEDEEDELESFDPPDEPLSDAEDEDEESSEGVSAWAGRPISTRATTTSPTRNVARTIHERRPTTAATPPGAVRCRSGSPSRTMLIRSVKQEPGSAGPGSDDNHANAVCHQPTLPGEPAGRSTYRRAH